MKTLKDSYFAFLLILPVLIVVSLLWFYPLFYSFYLSFHKTTFKEGKLFLSFIGLSNYINAFLSEELWGAFLRTFYFMVSTVSLELLIGMGIALLLNEEFKGRSIVRTLVLLPWALMTLVYAQTWKWIYNGSYGVLNAILKELGIIQTYQNWLGDKTTAMNAVVLSDIWEMTPLVVLLLLAGLQSIPEELYEASKIDGASAWRRFRHITLPLLKPSVLVAVTLRLIHTFKVFDAIYILTRGGPGGGTTVIMFHIYNETFKFSDFGYGAALSYIALIFFVVLAIIYIKASSRGGKI
jgi:multiple sugar transport system permease protein